MKSKNIDPVRLNKLDELNVWKQREFRERGINCPTLIFGENEELYIDGKSLSVNLKKLLAKYADSEDRQLRNEVLYLQKIGELQSIWWSASEYHISTSYRLDNGSIRIQVVADLNSTRRNMGYAEMSQLALLKISEMGFEERSNEIKLKMIFESEYAKEELEMFVIPLKHKKEHWSRFEEVVKEEIGNLVNELNEKINEINEVQR